MKTATAVAAMMLIGSVAGLPGQGTSRGRTDSVRAASPPAMLLGTFTDDYGGSYTVTPQEFVHGRSSHYIVTSWHPAEQYLIAQNGPNNPSAPGLWTRIDWMPLADMAPWEWAFCLSAYEAPTAAAAEATLIADRANPKKGCNTFPFSRMKRTGPAKPQ